MTFKNFLVEGPRKLLNDTGSLVFARHFNQPQYYIPITDLLADEARGGPHYMSAFHILSVESIAYLIGLEHTDRSISTSLKPEFEEALNGVLPGHGGAVAKVYGHALVDAPFDVYSKADENGIRWVDLARMVDFAQAAGKAELAAQLSQLIANIATFRRKMTSEAIKSGILDELIERYRNEYFSVWDPSEANDFLTPLYTGWKDDSSDTKWTRLAAIVQVARDSGWDFPSQFTEDYLEGLEKVLGADLETIKAGVIDIRDSVGEVLTNGHDEIIMDDIQIQGFLMVGPKASQDYRTLGYHRRFPTSYVVYPAAPNAEATFKAYIDEAD